MRIRWVMPEGAARRLRSFPTGRRGLLSAIREEGHELTIMPWPDGARRALAELPPYARGMTAFYGGHEFLRAARRERPDLAAGIFAGTTEHAHDALVRRLGGMCLNHDAEIITARLLRQRVAGGETLFARPVACDKAFAGGVLCPADLARLDLLPDVPVVASPPRTILAEYRFIVALEEDVTGSQYARGVRSDVRIDTDPACAALACVAARLHAPAPLFVCDVAQTPDGPRVVEYNGFSAAGLYACDGRAIVSAAERVAAALRTP